MRTKISSVTIRPDAVSKTTTIGSLVPAGAAEVATPLITWTLVISSSSRKRATSTSCTTESLIMNSELKWSGTAGLRWVQCTSRGLPSSPSVISFFEGHVLGVEAAHEADLDQRTAQRRLLLHDRVGRRDVGGQRLLAQHRDARGRGRR